MRTPALLARLAPALAALAVLASCNVLEPEHDVRIRLTNASAYDLHGVVVGFPDGQETYGDLAAGASSEYRAVPKAYGYAFVQATVNGKVVVQQPIDYVGEALLDAGRYTYVVTVGSPDDPYGIRTELRR